MFAKTARYTAAFTAILASTLGIIGTGPSATADPTTGTQSVGSALVAGGAAEYRIRQLTSMIHWNKNLEEAKQEARKSGKLIFWMQMLGSLDGFA